jgi:hypothetical protein
MYDGPQDLPLWRFLHTNLLTLLSTSSFQTLFVLTQQTNPWTSWYGEYWNEMASLVIGFGTTIWSVTEKNGITGVKQWVTYGIHLLIRMVMARFTGEANQLI